MDNVTNEQAKGFVTVEPLMVFRTLLRGLKIIIPCTVLCGLLTFFYTVLFVKPQYQASAMVYVNNTNESTSTVSNSELTGAKGLLDLYVVVLKSEDTMDLVRKTAQLDYSSAQLANMVNASSVNNTAIFRITATAKDAAEAKLIVDTVVSVLPDRIESVFTHGTVTTVSEARLPKQPSSPHTVRNTLLGASVGLVISAAAVVIVKMLDNKVHDEDYLTNTYHIPVLAVVPNLRARSKSTYGSRK